MPSLSVLFATATLVVSSALLVSASVGFDNCTRHFVDPAELPDSPSGAVHVCREGYYGISYDKFMIDPAWTAYYITPENVHNNIPGRLSFYEDPDLEKLHVTQASVDADVFGMDWNRGHLCPNRIVSYTDEGKRASMSMGNIAPQEGAFNQHVWMYLETDVYEFIGEREDGLYIVTGVAYKNRDDARRDSKDNIAYPDYYWKCLCDPKTKQSVGFYGFNEEWDASEDVRRGNRNVSRILSGKRGGKPISTNLRMENFISVREVEDVYGGPIFPERMCDTTKVDRSYWPWSSESYESGARTPFRVFEKQGPRAMKALYRQHKKDFRRE